MTVAQLRAEAKEKDAMAEWLATNPAFHRKRIRELRIAAANLRSRALELEQKHDLSLSEICQALDIGPRRDLCPRCGREQPAPMSPCPNCQEAA